MLITVAILGLIATFTIPKIITSNQNGQYNAKAKEVAAMVSGAYQQYQAQNSSVTAGVGIEDLTPYMNYVATDTSTVIDDKQNQGTYTCGGGGAAYCLRLHNGAMFRYGRKTSYNFGGTSATDNTWFDIDPDSTTDGTTNGPGKALEFVLFYNGRISTRGVVNSSNQDPLWFNWQQ